MRNTISVLFLITTSLPALAQVSTGTPPFSSIGGGLFDQVNLGNLNVHFAVPVLAKAGRGIPFVYNLTYDSSIWTPVTTNGVTQWQPSSTWGWNTGSAALAGYVSATTTVTVTPGPPCTYVLTTWSNYTYHDVLARQHPFVGDTWEQSKACGGPPTWTYSSPLNASTTDGSGYVINVGPQPNVWSVTATAGQVITGSSYTDSNGNQISGGGTEYFDTLSSTTPVLTAGGSGTPSSPTTFTYDSPSGGNATVTLNYTQYTVATDFGFTSNPQIQEAGPNSVALVSSIQLPDGTEYEFTYEKTPGSCTPLSGTYSYNCVTGRLASVTLPMGGEITYTYSGGPNGTGIYSDGSVAVMTRGLSSTTTAPAESWSYLRTLVTGSPGPGSTWTTTVTDPSSNQTVINFAEDSATNSSATYNFYETQRQMYEGSISANSCSSTVTTNCLLLTTLKCYNGNYGSCSTATVSSPITQTDSYSELLNGSTRLSQTLYNSHGLVTDDKEYNYGVTTGAAPSSSFLVRETAISYASLGNGIVNKPSSMSVYDWTTGTQVTLSSSSYSYDQTTPSLTSGTPQHIAITGSRGNLTTLASQANSSITLYRTFSYWDTGNLNTSTGLSTSSTSPGPNTTYNYDSESCGNSFITSISEPLGLSRSMSWSCAGGVETSGTDENSQTVTINYTDPYFWRPANTYDQENNETTIAYSGQTATENTLSFNGGQSVADARLTVDGFGRPILSQRLQGPGATSYDTTETDYNSVGLASRSTMPFSATAGGTNSTAPAKVFTYDALGRPLSVADSDGGTRSYTYTDNDVLVAVSGSQTFKRQLEYDGLGRLTSVCEVSSTLPGVGTCGQTTSQTGYWTRYTYDALGHLLSVTQNAQASSSSQQTRAYAYDLLGRLTSESNPETGKNGSNGTITYTYDSVSPCGDGNNYLYAGALVQRKDNAGDITCYAYDALNRVTKEGNSSVSNTTLREFVYDAESTYPTGVTVVNGKTRLVEAKTVNTSSPSTVVTDEFFSYSARGELTDVYESTPHSNGFYHTTASYWPSGSLDALSGIPSVPTLYFGAMNGAGLDGEGRYTEVTAAYGTNPITGVTYSTSSTTNYLGALTNVTFGSGDGDSFSYDSNTGRMTKFTFSVNSQNDVGSLTWSSNGTLQQLVVSDSIPGTSDSQTCNYGYDDLRRVSSVNCGTLWAQNFSYDALGNISKSVPSGSNGLTFLPTYYTSPPTNQFLTLPGTTPQYDSNGNLLQDNLNTYTWDPNWGNMLTVDTGSTTVTALYDAFGRMVENNASGSYYALVYGPSGRKLAIANGQTLVRAFVSLPGGVKGVYTSSGLSYYRHSDWLGSSRLTSTSSRTLYSSTAYGPFGEQYATAGTADASFTGMDQDTVSSLYDFLARKYSPSQGRWISPDPLGTGAVNPANPQSWNRYAYAFNNPLALIDSLGMSVRRKHRIRAMDDDPPPTNPVASGDDDDDDDGGGGGVGGDDDDDDDDNGGNTCDATCQQAEQNALDALDPLTNPDCGQFIDGDTGTAASTLEANLADQNDIPESLAGYPSSLATITTGDLGTVTGSGVGAQTTGTLEPSQVVNGINVSGGVGAPWTITLNSNPGGLFLLPIGEDIGMPMVYDVQTNQAITILHELGHAADDNGYPSGVINDDSNPDQSMQNTANVAANCFANGNAGGDDGSSGDGGDED